MSDLMLTLLYVVLLLIANRFFVAAEFALVKVRPVRLEQLAVAGSRAAARTLKVLGNLEIYLAACQLGITMASLGLGWIGEPFVAALLKPLFITAGLPEHWLHPISFTLGFLIFSSLHIVIGEQMPKTLAIRQAEFISRLAIWPLVGFYYLVWPLTVSLDWASRTLLRLFGVKEAGHDEVHTDDELRSLINVSQRHGMLRAPKAAMLDRMFEFDARKVGEVMTPRTLTAVLDVDREPEVNKQVLLDTSHSRYPLVSSRSGEVLGVIIVKDLYEQILRGDQSPWGDLAAFKRAAMFVPELMRVDRLLEQMRRRKSHIAIVVDEYGAFTGLVTLEDLLEEIVGEIDDEYDDEGEEVAVKVDNTWVVSGILPLYEVAKQTGLSFDGIDGINGINTLSGLFMQRLGRVPMAKDYIELDNFRLEVVDMIGTRVGTVRVRPVLLPGSV
jgi:CBS domain containing-hemolysin-like protein